MKNYKVIIDMVKNEEKKENSVILGVRGKNLDNETIKKRLINYVNTLQSEYNRGYAKKGEKNYTYWNIREYKEV